MLNKNILMFALILTIAGLFQGIIAGTEENDNKNCLNKTPVTNMGFGGFPSLNCTKHVKAAGVPNQKVSTNVRCSRIGLVERLVITDLDKDAGACVSIAKGGVHNGFVEVHIESQVGRGYDVEITTYSMVYL